MIEYAPDQVDQGEGQLIARARVGDQAAWRVLVERYQESIFRMAFLLLRDPAEAEDVAQETFIRAYLKFDSFDARRPLAPWLMRIAINLARNRLRTIGRYLNQLRRAFERESLLNRDDPWRPDPAVGRRWLSERLGQAVERLSPAAQEVIYMRYFLDLSEAEMAEALGVAPGTVKSRLARARRRLGRLIDSEYHELKEALDIDLLQGVGP